MLMMYLSLLTPLLAYPALMLLARLERWATQGQAAEAATESRRATVPRSPHRRVRSDPRRSQMRTSGQGRNVAVRIART
jgi:hypothetical protein